MAGGHSPTPRGHPTGLQVGDYRVHAVVDGTFALDGGSMFGVVPRPLWERSNPPDERNRIDLASRLLYLEGAGRRILIDTGLGDKWDDKRQDIFKVRRPGGGLLGWLAAHDVSPESITDVVLTHLHFDHAAGTTQRRDDDLVLTFPQARHYVQRRHWEWAQHPTLKDGGSFRAEDFAPLAGSGQLELLDGDAELFPGIDTVVLDGHTTAMQAIKIHGQEATLFYLADLVPTVTHLRWPYIMGFDNQPLVTLAEKQRYLRRAAEAGWWLVLEHDPQTAAVQVLEKDGVLVPDPSARLAELERA